MKQFADSLSHRLSFLDLKTREGLFFCCFHDTLCFAGPKIVIAVCYNNYYYTALLPPWILASGKKPNPGLLFSDEVQSNNNYCFLVSPSKL